MREATPDDLGIGPIDAAKRAAVDAILADLRDRRLLKWLFRADADTNPIAIGYVDGPIDNQTQNEMVAKWVDIVWSSLPQGQPL
jgi:hypothetical protein